MKLEAFGDIKDGKLVISNKRRFEEDLRQFKDCRVEIIIKKSGRRSSPQNRYYFGVIVKEIQIRFRELGHRLEPEEVHEFLKQKFNKAQIVTPQAEVIEVGKTTTDLNKDEFTEYMERIKEWASESLEIYIPDPNEQTKIF